MNIDELWNNWWDTRTSTKELMSKEAFTKAIAEIISSESLPADLLVMPKIAEVIKAINDEPEFTDEMPEDMVEALKEKNIDPDLIKFMLQWAVRLTKENIIKRINSNFSA